MPGTPIVVVDAANVVGARPTGWWRDRAGAARGLGDRLADLAAADGRCWVLVLEGAAKAGVAATSGTAPGTEQQPLRVVHADGSGDDRIVDEVAAARAAGAEVTVVTADRELRARCTAAGADAAGPGWLWRLLDGDG